MGGSTERPPVGSPTYRYVDPTLRPPWPDIVEPCEAERRITIAQRWLQSVINCRGQSAHIAADRCGCSPGSHQNAGRPDMGLLRRIHAHIPCTWFLPPVPPAIPSFVSLHYFNFRVSCPPSAAARHPGPQPFVSATAGGFPAS